MEIRYFGSVHMVTQIQVREEGLEVNPRYRFYFLKVLQFRRMLFMLQTNTVIRL